MTIRAGIIGAGRIAWAYDGGIWDGHGPSVTIASCLHRHPQTKLVAVFDPVAEARSAFDRGYKGPRPVTIYDSLRSFLNESLDLIAIASPSMYHFAHISACLDAKVPRLWIEKPVTLDMASFNALRARISTMTNPPRSCVNYMRRSLPQLSVMQRHLAESPDAFGGIAIGIRYSRRLEVNGVHMLDFLSALTGATELPTLDFLRCAATGHPQFGLTLCGMPVTVTGYPLPYHLIELDITDSRGRLSLAQGGQYLTWEPAEPNPDYPGFFRLGKRGPVVETEGSKQGLQNATFNMLVSLIDDSAQPVSTIETAWFAQALMEIVQATCWNEK